MHSLFGARLKVLRILEECDSRASFLRAVESGVSPTKVRKVPQDSCQLPGRKGFSAIPELPRRDLVWSDSFGGLIPTES
jgi:hypothetical protein